MSETQETEETSSGFFSKLKKGLSKTRQSLAGGFDNIIHGKAKVETRNLEDLEEALLIGDVGFETTSIILEKLKKGVADERLRTQEEVFEQLKNIMVDMLETYQKAPVQPDSPPKVILVIGVNGSGKTTTIGKLSQKWTEEGKKVILAAGDTFRAAAIEQLQQWADRVGVFIVKQKSGSDPSAVAFDAVQAGKARGADIVLVDTAGRLQTNQNLMAELVKIKRVIGKVMPEAPHETLLVLDASIGQNSVSQAKLFNEALSIDGLVMTKLDGTSKGGVLLNITQELKLPVRYIGIGEKTEDLQEFDPKAFVEALF